MVPSHTEMVGQFTLVISGLTVGWSHQVGFPIATAMALKV